MSEELAVTALNMSKLVFANKMLEASFAFGHLDVSELTR